MSGFKQGIPECLRRHGFAHHSNDQGQQSASGACLDRGHPAGVNATKNQSDQQQCRQRFGGDLSFAHPFAVINDPSPNKARCEAAHEPDRNNIGKGQHDAWNHARKEHVTDRLFGHEGIDDQHRRWRDDHAKHRAASHHPNRKARVVFLREHLRHGHFGKNRSRCDGRSRYGGEHSVRAHGAHPDAAFDLAKTHGHDLVDVAAQTGF